MILIVGLGNPGNKYAGSRHNIGFELIDQLAQSYAVNFTTAKGPFLTAKATYQNQQLVLVKPTTFMNNSGDAVQQACHWFKIEPQACLVCYDDLNLDVGTIRLRRGGSAGGHNGVKDIIQKLGTKKFPRLRIGIGDDFGQGRQVQHVLSAFTKKERSVLNKTLDTAIEAVQTFAKDGIEQAMNTFN